VCDEGLSAVLSRERATVLSRVLHGEFGFFGDTKTYDAPVNAGCSTVSGACRLRCRSSMWDGGAYVLNLPGHVLVQIGEKNPVVTIPSRVAA
jgi:hypothetical protein